jgi:protein farnesyltransferase subunit beta
VAEIDPAGPIAAARADNPLLRVNIKPPIAPSQQAQRQVEQRELSQQAITMQALAASEQVHAALASSTQRTQLAASAEARGLLNAAHKARESLEAAQENGKLVEHSALALCGSRNDALPAVWFECNEWDCDSMDDATAQLLQVSAEDVHLPQSSSCLMDAAALQLWLLRCCQVGKGGLRDKPGKGVDHYHTCYCLSGLAAAQGSGELVLGGADNEVAKTDAACNVVRMKLNRARVFFARRSL